MGGCYVCIYKRMLKLKGSTAEQRFKGEKKRKTTYQRTTYSFVEDAIRIKNTRNQLIRNKKKLKQKIN